MGSNSRLQWILITGKIPVITCNVIQDSVVFNLAFNDYGRRRRNCWNWRRELRKTSAFLFLLHVVGLFLAILSLRLHVNNCWLAGGGGGRRWWTRIVEICREEVVLKASHGFSICLLLGSLINWLKLGFLCLFVVFIERGKP